MGEIIESAYTIEQFQRCLSAATDLNYAVLDMKRCPLTSDILNEVYRAQREYLRVQTEVVNEASGKEKIKYEIYTVK